VIRIDCDNCEKTFEARPEDAGGKVSCPYCGDINRVPEQHRPESRGLPPDHGPEKEICTVHPAMFRAHPFRGLLILILLVGGIVGAAYAWKDMRWLAYISLAPTVAAVVWAGIWTVSAFFWVRLVISNKRTVREEGIITRTTSEVLHDHVRNVEIRQSFLQRITNVGWIGISSAGQDDIEIQVKDIPSPYRIKKLIDEYRDM
jgi:hypothetical protein